MWSLEDARKTLSSGGVIIFAGPCIVVYEGRAASKLGEGERLVIIKKDRSILVHRPTGYEPVNWQPPGCVIEFRKEGNLTHVRAANRDELLKITFLKEPVIMLFELRDDAAFEMYASEEDMKKAVLAKPDLVEDGFKPFEEERQVKNVGRVDILGVDKDGKLMVIELKRKTATGHDVKQLSIYVRSLAKEFGKKPRAVLAAPSITRTARREMVNAGIEFRCLTPKRCMEVLRKLKGLNAYL